MTRILVAGELNVDLIMAGLPGLPILGRELAGDSFHIVMGSSSAITAARIAALGAEVDFVGLVGDDDMGRLVLRFLKDLGVGTDHITLRPDGSTGVTMILTYPHDRAMMTYPGVMIDFDGLAITPDLLSNYTHLHVGSFFLQTGLQANLPQVFRTAHAQGLTVSLDSGWDPIETWFDNPYLEPALAEVDYFFPNKEEALAIMGGVWNPAALAEKVRGTLFVKMGGEGALAVWPDTGDIVQLPALPVDVVDTTGAGDAFNAGIIYSAVIEQIPLRKAMAFAVACGAHAVGQIGGTTNLPRAEEVRQLMGQHAHV